MQKFGIFNQYRDAIIVLNDKYEILFTNNVFKRVFGKTIDIKRFAHKFNFDICLLDTENLEYTSPIFQAVCSKQNFTANATYKNENSDFLYYEISTIQKQKYTVLFLSDISAQIKLNFAQEKIMNLETACQNLQLKNESLNKIKTNAQSQAIKIALINKVSNIFSESIDLPKTLNSALKELLTIFGAGQPILMSNISAPFLSIESPAFAIISGSLPKSSFCTCKSSLRSQKMPPC